MRKAISLLLVLCMVFALCGCGSGGSAGSADTVKEENATVSSGETEKDLISANCKCKLDTCTVEIS